MEHYWRGMLEPVGPWYRLVRYTAAIDGPCELEVEMHTLHEGDIWEIVTDEEIKKRVMAKAALDKMENKSSWGNVLVSNGVVGWDKDSGGYTINQVREQFYGLPELPEAQ